VRLIVVDADFTFAPAGQIVLGMTWEGIYWEQFYNQLTQY